MFDICITDCVLVMTMTMGVMCDMCVCGGVIITSTGVYGPHYAEALYVVVNSSASFIIVVSISLVMV